MTAAEDLSRRRGGRDARRAMRARPGVPHMDSRVRYAEQIAGMRGRDQRLNAYMGANKPAGFDAMTPTQQAQWGATQNADFNVMDTLANNKPQGFDTWTPTQQAQWGARQGGGGPQAPVQVASLNPNFVPASAPPPSQRMQPAQQKPAVPQMSDITQAAAQPQPMQQQAAMAAPNNRRMADLMQLMANPWLDESKKRVVQMMLEQEMQRADPAYQMKMQSDQIGLEKSRLELQQMRNPPPPKPEYITSKDGSVLAVGPDGAKVIYGAQPEPVKPTADLQEYQYAVGQGYKGSFQEYQLLMKKAGASQVNIDQKAEGAFDKTLAESQAKAFDAMATDGMSAKADAAVIEQLSGLLGNQGGMLTGISGALAQYGIGGEGVSDLQAADALINKLIPSQRQAGSGSMSDRDVEMFRASLPSLWKTPEGNKLILNTMSGLAQYRMAQGEIAQRVQMGEMSRQDAVKALRALPNPLAGFAKMSGGNAAPGAGDAGLKAGAVEGGYRFKGGDPSDANNWEQVQ